jgi:MoxR-like ATPase
MPSDIIGFERYNQAEKTLEPREGPALKVHVLLADEINRMSPRSQSALLGVMTHGVVTIGDQQCRAQEPFVVLATRNPVETQGIYPLPEAVLDRFMLEIVFPQHSYEAMRTIIGYANAAATQARIENDLQPILDRNGIQAAREQLAQVGLGDVWRWATALYLACQPSEKDQPDPRMPRRWQPLPETNEVVQIGPSPRGLRDLVQAVRGLAYLRMAANPAKASADRADCHDAARAVLRHRIVLRRSLPPAYTELPPERRVDHFLKKVWKEVENRQMWQNVPEFPEGVP